MKQTHKNRNTGIALGMMIGLALGSSIGSSLDNIATGTSTGIIFGLLVGLLLGESKDKKVNKQIQTNNYTIKDIKPNGQNGEYIITIVDKLGDKSEVIMPKGQMEVEQFSIDDVVYLDDEGMIEQAYDKEDE